MTIWELRELFVDDSQECYIYDLNTDKVVYEGRMDEMSEELENEEISSLDNIYPDNKGVIGINVEIEKED